MDDRQLEKHLKLGLVVILYSIAVLIWIGMGKVIFELLS